MKSLAASVIVLILISLSASTVFGCSCEEFSQRKKFRTADYIFLGQAVRMSDSQVPNFAYAVTFNIERQWKGAKLREPLVNFTFDSPGMCGDLRLAEGQRFLIYAYREKNDLISYTDCGPNLQAQNADGAIRKLSDFWFRFLARLIPFG